MKLRIGIDTGGTFTDICLFDEETRKIAVTKLSSTPDDPSRAILQGIIDILRRENAKPSQINYLAHGTTVATNTLIQHKGARTGLITTSGFRDLLELGRQRRPNLYDLQVDKPEPLIPRELRLEVKERLNYEGRIEIPLDKEEVFRVVRALKAKEVESIAVCFLYSYLNPSHEELVKEIIREEIPDLYVSTSHEVLPEFREYERLSTVVINAYLGPVIDKYLYNLERQVSRMGISIDPYITQSNGGIISLKMARHHPVRTVLSGPSAGVVGAAYVGLLAGFKNIITFDMGGTSTDVSLVEDGQMKVNEEMEVQGYPIRLPMLEVNTVGAGGGSLAWIDKGGHLKVGPQSAGAFPGPACYGFGNEEPTVTDANVMLRTLNPDYLLGNRMPIDAKASERAIMKIAERLHMNPMEVAQGIISIVTSNMARAIRVVSVSKGYDPRDFTLVAFGGAGPLHAARLARELNIPYVLVPEIPGILCALGLLVTDIRSDYTLTHPISTNYATAEDIISIFKKLENQARDWLNQEGIPENDRIYKYSIYMRYKGQNYELRVPLDLGELRTGNIYNLINRFHQIHRQYYGYYAEDEPTQLVTFHLEALGKVPKATLKTYPKDSSDSCQALVGSRNVYLEEVKGFVECPVYRRDNLRHGNLITGPAIIEQMDSTTLILPNQEAVVDSYHNLIINIFGRNHK